MRYGKSSVWLLESGDRPTNEDFYRECLPGVDICFVDGVRDFLDYAKYADPDWLAMGNCKISDVPYTQSEIKNSGGLCFRIIEDLLKDDATKDKPMMVVSSDANRFRYEHKIKELGIVMLEKGHISPPELQRSVESILGMRRI